eukprot:CAMPEP_0205860456 /NCGR_PEP_ID=MMETSP1083-20121108/5245_1 /ASSEMBLY_ACC=CAM_ASM_000430 /TAXON_ID=97485 /ORGANISM="Prymnesium parvum, Strain Texoma1" /LENGTH=148 /DNA_ID=CAMNT_0053222093 /DNA_START=224 /DNA_END=668 /DNA_ORIENTATION=+
MCEQRAPSLAVNASVISDAVWDAVNRVVLGVTDLEWRAAPCPPMRVGPRRLRARAIYNPPFGESDERIFVAQWLTIPPYHACASGGGNDLGEPLGSFPPIPPLQHVDDPNAVEPWSFQRCRGEAQRALMILTRRDLSALNMCARQAAL